MLIVMFLRNDDFFYGGQIQDALMGIFNLSDGYNINVNRRAFLFLTQKMFLTCGKLFSK